MNNQNNRIHSAITHDSMCTIERQPSGSLRVLYHPISFDDQTRDSLSKMAKEMECQETNLCEEILDAAERATGVNFRRKNYNPVYTVLERFKASVQYVKWLTGIDVPILMNCTMHSEAIIVLLGCAKMIRGFVVNRADVEASRDKLEDSDYHKLENSFNTAIAMQPFLLSALDRYEKMFDDYIKEAEHIQPELFSVRNYCRDFTSTYSRAELNYSITYGNRYAVENVDEYYLASVLDSLYDAYEEDKNIIAYSHRKRGFMTYVIDLDSECELCLSLKTNFGYGRSSYFGSILSYKGINAINTPTLIFFNGVGSMSVFNFTYNYEVDEEDFVTCFEKAVSLHSELHTLGEADFVDKYFRESLSDLSELLRIVANTDTFLQITTLERLKALTESETRNVLLPKHFKDIEFGLSASEQLAADELATAIADEVCDNESAISTGVKELAEWLNPSLADYLGECNMPETDDIQLIVKKDLLKNRIIKEIRNQFSDRSNIEALSWVSSVIDELIPTREDIYAKNYEGYDLIKFRTEKASACIKAIKRLYKIAKPANLGSVIKAIAETCHQVSQQAKDHLLKEIEPKFLQVQAELDKAEEESAWKLKEVLRGFEIKRDALLEYISAEESLSF